MREIKFRAWDKQHKCMCNVNSINFKIKQINTLTTGEWAGKFKFFELMQFTGLKDKNGKEIYEGDIVRFCKGVPLIVFWNKNKFDLKNVKKEIDSFDILGGSLNQIEVIGNIYENPELLKEEEK